MGQRIIPVNNSDDIGIVIRSNSLFMQKQILEASYLKNNTEKHFNNRLALPVAYQVLWPERINNLVPN